MENRVETGAILAMGKMEKDFKCFDKQIIKIF